MSRQQRAAWNSLPVARDCGEGHGTCAALPRRAKQPLTLSDDPSSGDIAPASKLVRKLLVFPKMGTGRQRLFLTQRGMENLELLR